MSNGRQKPESQWVGHPKCVMTHTRALEGIGLEHTGRGGDVGVRADGSQGSKFHGRAMC